MNFSMMQKYEMLCKSMNFSIMQKYEMFLGNVLWYDLNSASMG